MSYSGTSPQPVAKGGTGQTTLAAAGIVQTTGAQDLAGALTAAGGLAVGSGGTAVSQIKVYVQTLTPASVNASTGNTQTFTVTGLTTADTVSVSPTSLGTGLGIGGCWVSAADTLSIIYLNATAGSLTPASADYRIVAFRS